MVLENKAKEELAWWMEHALNNYNVVTHREPDVIMTTDASSTGLGCALGQARTGGHWTREEAQHHINYLELLAVFLAYMTALTDINHMGTIKSTVQNELSKSVWLWWFKRNIWLTAVIFQA